MLAHCLTAYSAMLISAIDPNGDWVKAAYSYVGSNGVEQRDEFTQYDLEYDSEVEDWYFEYQGEKYHINDFHDAYGTSHAESE